MLPTTKNRLPRASTATPDGPLDTPFALGNCVEFYGSTVLGTVDIV
jgi:hypothetical protein